MWDSRGSAKFSIHSSFDRSWFIDIFAHTRIFVPPRLGLLEAPGAAYATAPHPPLFYALIAQDCLPLKVVALSLRPPLLPQLPSVFFLSTVAG